MNQAYDGGNLELLRERIAESVGLSYSIHGLTERDHNLFFK